MDLINKKEASRIILVNPSRRDMLETLDKTHDVFDGMTNGEVIQTLFHIQSRFTREDGYIEVQLDERFFHITYFSQEWWNAPYKKGEE